MASIQLNVNEGGCRKAYGGGNGGVNRLWLMKEMKMSATIIGEKHK